MIVLRRHVFPLAVLLFISVFLAATRLTALAQEIQQEPASGPLITGTVFDQQGQPVVEAEVTLQSARQPAEPLAEAITQPDGRYALHAPNPISDELSLHVQRPHFEDADYPFTGTDLRRLNEGQAVEVPELDLARQVTPAFWIATAIFGGVLLLVAVGVIHNTLAALLGAAVLFAVSYLGGALSDDLVIFHFSRALEYVDWNVIFLIMGMMIVIAVVERTGIFQWLAYQAYRVSGGKPWLLVPILMIIAGIASAFLDNVTTMLLMTPITVQIALAIGINPLAMLIPEVFASNVIGISTLIGTPTNILIGSYGNISFNDFATNLTPGVLFAFVGLVIYCFLIYRPQFFGESKQALSELLTGRLAERARITQPDHLRKAGWIGAGMLLLFIFGEKIHLLPSVTALLGATALLIWIRPDIEEMIEAVDWTTLVFFITLFIVVGGIQEVGLVSMIAGFVGDLVGGNLTLAMLAVIWLSAMLSMIIANIPFTAAMLPVVAYLTATVPGAGNKALFYCLSVGSAMGGNGTLIGASANMVTAGISDRAGYPITYAYFFRKGFPALLITVALATVWLLVRFLVLEP